MGWSGGIFSRAISGGWTADKVTTPAITAARHDVNDDDLAAGINACVPADGTKAMTGALNMGSHKVTNLTNGSDAQDAVGFSQMNTAIALAIPAGVILPYGGATAPTGYLLCDGSAVSRATYATLFSAIGTAYGSGNGSTTFNVPDLRDKVIVGKGPTCTPVGAAVGNATHVHTGPSHTHTGPSHTHTGPLHTHTGPSHTHSVPAHTHTGPSHTHSVPAHYHGMGSGANLNITSSGSHTHTPGNGRFMVDPIAAVSGGGGIAVGYTAVASTASASHTHPSANIAGSIGLVTGGVNGNAAMTSGAGGTGATGAGGTGATGASGTDPTGAGGTGATGASGTDPTGAGGTGNTGSANNLPASVVANHIIKT